jgi:hypothetical protein
VKIDDPLAQLRHLVPLRDLPEAERLRLAVIREGRGRPKQIEPRPEPSLERDDYLEHLSELRTQATAADPVVAASANPPRDLAVFDEALRQIAVESAAIKFLRIEAERRGGEIGALCSRRIDGLVRIGSLFCDRRRHEPQDLDVRGGRFQKIVSNFHKMMREAASETLGPEAAERFLAEYQQRLFGWEDRFDPPPPRGQSG